MSQIHQFEPLVLGPAAAGLLPVASEIVQQSAALGAMAHPATREKLRELLRAMNSYYSNRIEGQSTHPLNIERALRNDYSSKPDVAHLQRVAKAYLQAEQELEAKQGDALSGAFALEAHRAMYSRLDPKDRVTKDGSTIVPGALRRAQVSVGEHVPPTPRSLEAFLDRYSEVYSSKNSPADRLLAIACAHHRLAWIHPFEDGNGRADRLVTHAALFPLTDGLWSVARGLARRRDDYYARLADADSPRRGAYDGRGNLSLEGLTVWCRFFLEVCLDQVRFMAGLLALDGVKERLRAWVIFNAPKGLREEVALALHHVFAAGPVTRGEFKQLTGLKERTAQSQLALLFELGLLSSPSAKGRVELELPLHALQFLFPDLYPEAATRAED